MNGSTEFSIQGVLEQKFQCFIKNMKNKSICLFLYSSIQSVHENMIKGNPYIYSLSKPIMPQPQVPELTIEK